MSYITPIGELKVPAWIFVLLMAIAIGCTGALTLGAAVFPVWLNIVLGVTSMIISGLTGLSSKEEKK
jgi:hypothetical protein